MTAPAQPTHCLQRTALKSLHCTAVEKPGDRHRQACVPRTEIYSCCVTARPSVNLGFSDTWNWNWTFPLPPPHTQPSPRTALRLLPIHRHPPKKPSTRLRIASTPQCDQKTIARRPPTNISSFPRPECPFPGQRRKQLTFTGTVHLTCLNYSRLPPSRAYRQSPFPPLRKKGLLEPPTELHGGPRTPITNLPHWCTSLPLPPRRAGEPPDIPITINFAVLERSTVATLRL